MTTIEPRTKRRDDDVRLRYADEGLVADPGVPQLCRALRHYRAWWR